MNGPHCNIGFRQMNKVFCRSLPTEENSYYKLGAILRKNRMVFKRMALYNHITSVFLLSALLNSDEISPYIRLRLHECDFLSIRFHDFDTPSKSMRFGSVYTGPFSYCLRHAEVISDQRNLGKIKKKEESTISFLSAWRKVHPNSPGLTMKSGIRSFLWSFSSEDKTLFRSEPEIRLIDSFFFSS